MKENINEHDMTKKMMSVIRGFKQQLIKEDDAPVTASVPKFEKGDDLPDTENTELPKDGPTPLFPIEGYKKLEKPDERLEKISTAIGGIKLGIRVTSVYVKPKTEDFNGDIIITGEKIVDDENKIEFSLSFTQGSKFNSTSDDKLNEEEIKNGLKGYLVNLQNEPKVEEEYFYDVKK
jgi:hypothetical protein